jgi:hypothetical protein
VRPRDLVASIAPERWEVVLALVRARQPALWRDLERAAQDDQRIPLRLWQRYRAEERQQRVRRALGAPANAPLALRALHAYFQLAHPALVTRFLDLLALPHTAGVLAAEAPRTLPPERLASAVAALLAEFPRAEALLYLYALALDEDPRWAGLAAYLPPWEAALGSAPPAPEAAPGDAPPPNPVPEPPLPAPDAPAEAAGQAPAAAAAAAPPAPAAGQRGARARGGAAPAPAGVAEEGASAPLPQPRRPRHARNEQALSPPRGAEAERAATPAPPPPPPPPCRAPAAVEQGAEPHTPAVPATPDTSGVAPAPARPDRSPSPAAPPRPERAGQPGTVSEAQAPRPAEDPLLDAVQASAQFTALDQLLVQALGGALVGAPAAPDPLRLAAAVEELLRLAAPRPQSSFHVGLLEVLCGLACASARAGWSPAHWDWYHYGRLVGWTRQQRWSEIARFYTEEQPAAQRLLQGAADRFPLAGEYLCGGLLAADAPARAADALRHLAPAPPLALAEALLGAAERCLDEDRVTEAQALLDALAARAPAAPAAPALAAYTARLRRARARCAQACGLFAWARQLLEAELAQATGAERAALLSSLGLLAGGFARPGEVRLPEAEADPPPWLRRLEAGAAQFAAAVAAAPDATASFCLGALEWLRERPGLARQHFEAALQALAARPLPDAGRLRPQLQFYLGASLLLELDTPARERALRLLREGLAAGLRPAVAAWRRLLDLVALDPTLAGPLFELFSQHAPPPHGGGPEAGRELELAFLVRCAPYVEAARQRLAAAGARADLPAPRRWELLCTLLDAQRRVGDEAGMRATLDALEALAHAPGEADRDLLERWRTLLERPAQYEPAWSGEDVLWSRVRTLELLGRDEEAFWLLVPFFNRLLAEATPQALAAAEDLLARARQLSTSPAAREDVAKMTARLRHRQEAERAEQGWPEDRVAAQLRAGRSLRVLFVGGNETQARHQAALRAALARRDETTGARVVLHFLHPGFNSNWDKTLETVRGYRGRIDALVLMPLVRTELGRALRRLAGEFGIPWVPCTGKGYDSMERALRTALTLAAERLPASRQPSLARGLEA